MIASQRGAHLEMSTLANATGRASGGAKAPAGKHLTVEVESKVRASGPGRKSASRKGEQRTREAKSQSQSQPDATPASDPVTASPQIMPTTASDLLIGSAVSDNLVSSQTEQLIGALNGLRSCIEVVTQPQKPEKNIAKDLGSNVERTPKKPQPPAPANPAPANPAPANPEPANPAPTNPPSPVAAQKQEKHEKAEPEPETSAEAKAQAAPTKIKKRVVEVRVVFLKIGEIDTLREFFNADVFIQARWREPMLDKRSAAELQEVNGKGYWNPSLHIENILTEQKESTWITAQSNEAGEAYLVERRRVKGMFMESLELQDFPWDVQNLGITLTTEIPVTEIDLIPDENDLCGINLQTFLEQQEWTLHEHIETRKRIITQEYSSSSKDHAALSVICHAARRPGYFYWNVFLIVFFITSLAFATFTVSITQPQSRLQLSFTLFLTSVSFKFVINQNMPKISYLTSMDKYMLLSLVTLCSISVWHAIVAKVLGTSSDSQAMEGYVIIAVAGGFVLAHIVFILWLYFVVWKRRRQMFQKDKEYREWLKRKLDWQKMSNPNKSDVAALFKSK